MKKYLLTLLTGLFLTTAARAATIDFTYKYTFLDGSYFTGMFSGDPDADNDGVIDKFIGGIRPFGFQFTYYLPDGVTEYSSSFDVSFNPPVVRSDGGGGGLSVDFVYDGPESDVTGWKEEDALWIGSYVVITLFPVSDEEPIEFFEPFRPEAWELSPRFPVPDGGSSLLMFGMGMGLIGVVGKRLRRAA